MKETVSLEKVLGVEFKNPDLLRLAFIHSSFLNEDPKAVPESNERLEYLGDALLGLVVADELYRRYPDQAEGELTQMRAALVRGSALATLAKSLGLGEHLILGKGEESTGGRTRDSNMAATFEALVGAVYLDGGYRTARKFVLRIMGDALKSVGGLSTVRNAKSALQELVQSRGIATPSYRIVDFSGEDHAREFTAEVLVEGRVVGRGKGRRKAIAEQDAAQNALNSQWQDGL